MNHQHPWESYLKQVLVYNNPVLTSNLLKLRTEMMTSSDEINEKEKAMATEMCEIWNQIRLLG